MLGSPGQEALLLCTWSQVVSLPDERVKGAFRGAHFIAARGGGPIRRCGPVATAKVEIKRTNDTPIKSALRAFT
jgi:hypothetical protein